MAICIIINPVDCPGQALGTPGYANREKRPSWRAGPVLDPAALDCVRKNPFDFKLSEVLENDTKEKVALPEGQEQALSLIHI